VQLTQALADLCKTDVRDVKRLIWGKVAYTGDRNKGFANIKYASRPHTLKTQETAVAALLASPDVWQELSEEQQWTLCSGEGLGADVARWFGGLSDEQRSSGRVLMLFEAAMHNQQFTVLAKRIFDQAMLDADHHHGTTDDGTSVRRALLVFELERLKDESNALSNSPEAASRFDDIKQLNERQTALRARLAALSLQSNSANSA
jgi:hypothetical protein